MAPAQLVGGAAACASEADEGCAGFDWWSLDPNNTKMVHLLNMAVCSHDRMMSCRVDGDCSFHEASSKCIKKSKYIEFSAFPFYGIVDKDGPRPDPSVDKPKFDPIVKYAATGPNQWVTGPGTGTRTGSRTIFGAGIVEQNNSMIASAASGRKIFPEMWRFSRTIRSPTTNPYRRLRMVRSSARSSRPIEACIIEGVLLCMEMLLEVARWGGIQKHQTGLMEELMGVC